MNKKSAVYVMLAFCWIGHTVSSIAGEWPTYNCDNRRSGVTGEATELPLFERWRFISRHAPQPAWPDPAPQDYWHRIDNIVPSMTFDRAFETVGADGRIYFGSSVDDKIYCLDAGTGSVLWSFFTEGPIRFAPTVVEGKICVGSDDGAVYCLSAATGELVWKFIAAREERRLPGNGRIISMWPVRTGVLVEDTTAYFCAGLFPLQKVYLCAVDLNNGTEVWKREVEISPQGYMLSDGERVYVPTGRTAPAVFDMKDGAPRGTFSTPGGGFGLLTGHTFINGPGRRGGTLGISSSGSMDNIAALRGVGMVADRTTAYLHSHDDIAALDHARYSPLARKLNGLRRQRKAVEKEITRDSTEALSERLNEINEAIGRAGAGLKECFLWRSPARYPYALVKSADVLFAGGEDTVAAFSAADGRELWSAHVEGRAYGLALLGGRLLVSTDAGQIYCFGNTEVEPALNTQKKADEKATRSAGLAQYILEKSGIDRGYCLLLNSADPMLAYELVRQSRLRVVWLTAHKDRADAARRALDEAGVYGTAAVCQWDSDELPFADYFANLVVSAGTTPDSRLPGAPGGLFRVTRPEGGRCMIGCPSERRTPTELSGWAGTGWSRRETESRGGMTWTIASRGRLPGAGEWTHMYADAANTACSMDSLVTGEMTVQWFGKPGPREMIDRHHRNVSPLYKDGRLFAPGDGMVCAVDAYNGTILWETRIPDSRRLGAFLDSGSMVVDDETLYVVSGDRCCGFDVSTGARELTYTMPRLPAGRQSEWGYIACSGDMLFGSGRKAGASYRETSRAADNALWYLNMKLVGSDCLFGMNRETGELKWQYKNGVIVTTTIAVGEGNLYFIETSSPAAVDDPIGRMPLKKMFDGGEQRLVGINGTTGRIICRKSIDKEKFSEMIYMNYADGQILLSGSKKAGRTLDYSFCAMEVPSGKVRWTSTHGTSLSANGGHGEQNRHPTIVGDVVYGWPYAYDLETGERDKTWNFRRHGHGCGGVSASACALFWRGHNPWQYDLASERGAVAVNKVTRPGCWINIIPAGGLVLIPESSSGCTCGYPMQMSIAYAPK